MKTPIGLTYLAHAVMGLVLLVIGAATLSMKLGTRNRTKRTPVSRAVLISLAAALLLSACGDGAFASERGAASVSWQTPFEGGHAGPVLVNRMLYTGSQDGAIEARDPATGRVLWSYQTGVGLAGGSDFITLPPGSGVAEGMSAVSERREHGKREIRATLIVEDSTVLVGSLDHSFYALDAITGRLKWSFETKGEIYGRAIVREGRVYFASDDGYVYALDAVTGHVLWTFETLPGISQKRAPSVVWRSGLIYATTWDFGGPHVTSALDQPKTHVYALDAASGKAKWTQEVVASEPSPLAFSDSLVLFSAYSTQGVPLSRTAFEVADLHAVDAASGSLRWKAGGMKSAYGSHTPVVVAHGVALLGSDAGVFAYDLATGATRWSSPKAAVAGLWSSQEQRGDDQVVYATTVKGSASDLGLMIKGTLRALDLETGIEKWSFEPREGLARVASAQGNAIFLQAGRNVHCLTRETGKEMWSFRMKTWSDAPILVTGEMVFSTTATSGDGREHGVFYAIRPPGLEPPR